jgi:hypothetical protein
VCALQPTATASQRTLLNRILANATWFRSHYNTELVALQLAQANEAAPERRQELVAEFEGALGARDVWNPMMVAQAERLEVELRAVRLLCVGPEIPLGSHPVGRCASRSEAAERGVPECRVTAPEDLGLQLEAEMQRKEMVTAGRARVVEGVDEDMILRFWETNPDI